MSRKRKPPPPPPPPPVAPPPLPRPPTTLAEPAAELEPKVFDSPQSRYFLRAGVSTMLAFLAALGVAITDSSVTGSEWVTIMLATVGAAGAYLGVGAAVPSVEPFVGNKYAGADVPVPPAQPTKP